MKNSNHTILAISLILILSGSFASNIKAQDSSDNAAKTDRADGFDTPQESLAAAIGLINPERLQKYPDLTITNAFQGQAAGLTVVSGDGGFSNNSSTIYIRGQHGGATPAIIIVDGIERSIDDLAAEEIGSIEVLKDAPAKILYGPRATNGVILITTKRGIHNSRNIKATIEYGVSPSTRMPSYLDSYDYATLYNEARENDGLSPYYLPYQLEGYRNSSGQNDVLYPNIDWYGTFTKSMGSFRKVMTEFTGGSSKVKYALVAGYTGGSGIEKVASSTQLHRFNVRGNLDIRITDFLSVCADVAARLESRNWYGMTSSDLFNKMSTYRPNEYPFMIDHAEIGMEPNEDGSPYYGGSLLHPDNVYVSMTYGGERSERYVNSQTDFGLNFNFDKYVRGLFADAFITFDNMNLVGTTMNRTYATYSVDGYLDENREPQKRVVMVRKINRNDNINVSTEKTTRKMGFRANGGYKGVYRKHEYSAVAAFRYYKSEALGANQDCITTNTTLRLNYGWNGRLFAEATAGITGSNQFSRNRFLPVGSAALSYILSTEPYLKIRASGGHLGYNPNGNYLLYKTAWTPSGDYMLGNNNNTNAHITQLARLGNERIGWVTQNEGNIGIDGSLFRNRLSFGADFFFEKRDNIITSLSSRYSDLIGSHLPAFNYGSIMNYGAELEVTWKDQTGNGDFKYEIGANMTLTRNENIKVNEIDSIESYRSSIGHPASGIYGLKSQGLFGKDVKLNGHPKQMFGYYTDGDIAYEDMNGDGVIDDKDNTYLGQSFPMASFGICIDLKYKGLELYVLGTSNIGQSVLLSNTYYRNTGSNSYSDYALKRYHPVNNPSGTLPRLTTTSGTNSYRTSDFWLRNGSWFRLKNVEISYTFNGLRNKAGLKSCRLFTRGTNLFVLSGIKELDPERLDAGVTNYPVYMTITGGVSLGF